MEKMMIIWWKRWWRIEIVSKNEEVDDIQDGEGERERVSESPPNMGELDIYIVETNDKEST